MADGLAVQSYLESVLQATGKDYEIISIHPTKNVTVTSTMQKIESYTFKSAPVFCSLCIQHTLYNSASAVFFTVIHYIPLSFVPQSSNVTPCYNSNQTSSYLKQYAVLSGDTLDFYAISSTGSISITGVTIGSITALVTYD